MRFRLHSIAIPSPLHRHSVRIPSPLHRHSVSIPSPFHRHSVSIPSAFRPQSRISNPVSPIPYLQFRISNSVFRISNPVSPTPYSVSPAPYSVSPIPYSVSPIPYSVSPTSYSIPPAPYSASPTPVDVFRGVGARYQLRHPRRPSRPGCGKGNAQALPWPQRAQGSGPPSPVGHLSACCGPPELVSSGCFIFQIVGEVVKSECGQKFESLQIF